MLTCVLQSFGSCCMLENKYLNLYLKVIEVLFESASFSDLSFCLIE